MRPSTNWQVSVISAVAGTAVVLIAIVYLFDAGFKVAQYRYWKIMDVALVCLMVAAVFGMRYRTLDWHDRPDKRQRLRIGKWLIVLLMALGIPMLIVNWNR
jgi:hypothetical protein